MFSLRTFLCALYVIYTILGNTEIIMEAPLEGLSRAGDGVQGGMQTK